MKFGASLIRSMLASFSLTGLMVFGVTAQPLPKPQGPVLLTVSGKIGQRNVGDSAQFDAAMLDALPLSKITTTSPSRDKASTYSGPSLKSILERVNAQGSRFRLKAADRYEIDIPAGDITLFNPVIARRLDGHEMKIRDRGPLLLMYPFDSYPKLQNNIYYARAVWQLQHIVVE